MDKEQRPKQPKTNRKGYVLVQSLTLARIPISIIFAILLLSTETSIWMYAVATCLLIIGELTDALDGLIARRYNLVTEYGAALDPLSDSITRLIVYWSLASKNLVIFVVPLVMAIRDIMVAYTRIVLAQKNQTVSARISGKIKANVQAFGAFFALYGPVYWNKVGSWSFYAVSWIILLITAFSAFEYVRDAYKAIRMK